MRKEYQTAIVHQAKVQTVERVLNAAADYSTYPKDVWSAMCPYLVLEVRRDFLVEDTLEQLEKKVYIQINIALFFLGGGLKIHLFVILLTYLFRSLSLTKNTVYSSISDVL